MNSVWPCILDITSSFAYQLVLSEVNMQLIVRGEQTHVLDVAPTANVEALRAQLSLLEVNLFPLKTLKHH